METVCPVCGAEGCKNPNRHRSDENYRCPACKRSECRQFVTNISLTPRRLYVHDTHLLDTWDDGGGLIPE